MGVIDYGKQTISFDFKEVGKSENFNKLNYKLNETGIYEGGLLSYIDTTHISVAPFLAFAADDNFELAVRLETEEAVELLVGSNAPYCIIRFDWSNIENNYADIMMSSYANLLSDDLVLGRVVYDGTTLETFFDYNKKHIPILATDMSEKDNFKVLSQEPYSDTVSVVGGVLNTGNESITIPTADSPAISDTTLGRIDLVYLDLNGDVRIVEGSDSATPVTPNYSSKNVLAEIHRGAGKTYVTGADIIQIKDSLNTGVGANIDNSIATQKSVTIPKSITQFYTNLIQDPTDLTTDNWVLDTGVTVELSDESIYGMPFTKIITDGSGINQDVRQLDMIVTASVKHTASVILRKYDNLDYSSRFYISPSGETNYCVINWDTQTVTSYFSGVYHVKWIDKNTVQVWLTTRGTVSATSSYIRIIPVNPSGIPDVLYATAVQLVDDTTTAFPFVDGSKEADEITEAFTMPDQFTLDVILEPKFTYDTAEVNKHIFRMGVGSGSRFELWYEEGSDYFLLVWEDGTSAVTMVSQQFDDGSSYINLNQKIRLTMSIDTISGNQTTSRFLIIPLESGSIYEDTTWNGTPDIKNGVFDFLNIGHNLSGEQVDSEFEYLRVYEGLLEGTVTGSSDADHILLGQNLLFDANIDEFKETQIEEGTSVSSALSMIGQDIKTGVAIQDKAILDRHYSDDARKLKIAGTIKNGYATNDTVHMNKIVYNDYVNEVPNPTRLDLWNTVNSTVEDSGESYQGYKFWKVIADGSGTSYIRSYYQNDVSNGTVVYSFILRKGNQDSVIADLYSASSYNDNISINFSTKSVVLTLGGTLVEHEWLDDVTVKIAVMTTSLTQSLQHELRFFTGGNVLDDSVLVSQPQIVVSQQSGSYPFIEDEHVMVEIDKSIVMPDKFTTDVILKPSIKSDILYTDRTIWEWRLDATHKFSLYFSNATDSLECTFIDTAGSSTMTFPMTFMDSGDLTHGNVLINQRLRVAISADVSGGESKGYLFALDSNDQAIATATFVVKSSDISIFHIGYTPEESRLVESEYEYLRIYQDTLSDTAKNAADVDEMLRSQTLILDTATDSFTETIIEDNTPIASAIDKLAHSFKTGQGIQDSTIKTRHLDSIVYNKLYNTEDNYVSYYSSSWNAVLFSSTVPWVTSLGKNKIAAYGIVGDLIRMYEYVDTDLVQVGNDSPDYGASLKISGASENTFFAFNYDGTNNLKHITFDGSDFTEDGAITLTADTGGRIAAISDTRLLHIGKDAHTLRIYDWNGTTFTQYTTVADHVVDVWGGLGGLTMINEKTAMLTDKINNLVKIFRILYDTIEEVASIDVGFQCYDTCVTPRGTILMTGLLTERVKEYKLVGNELVLIYEPNDLTYGNINSGDNKPICMVNETVMATMSSYDNRLVTYRTILTDSNSIPQPW